MQDKENKREFNNKSRNPTYNTRVFGAHLTEINHELMWAMADSNPLSIEELTEFKDLSSTLSDLSSNLLTKYYKKKTRAFKSSFFECLNDYAKGNVKVFIAKKKGAIVGFSLCLRHGKTLDAFCCGFNYELQEKTDFTYFNLGYYSPISWAIQEGIRKIYYRQTADKVKLRLGCKPERVYSFVKCHNRQVNSQISNYIKIKNRISQAKR